ncbi:uncharacterized protein LOC143184195 isoform X2 [Calliopsis andreniformis]|uniref:uncharacterized protein LOC143184195 isoform X2 n=1 Tax=Calliopsis andreniformis TaxID=337506 RepID=UPI003FCD2422
MMPVSNLLCLVLRVAISEIHNSYVCIQCYNLFQMLEQAQKTVSNIRCEILKIYRATERRRNVKQSTNNDTNVNLCTKAALEEIKLHVSNNEEELKEKPNFQVIQIEEMVKQQCIQDKLTSQIINLPNKDCDIYAKTIIDSKRNIKKKAIDCNETENAKSFDYSNNYINVKNDEILGNNVLHNSIAITNDNNLFNISSSQANIQTLKLHIEKEDCVSLTDSEKNKSGDFIKINPIFCNNKLQVQSIEQSVDFKWKEAERNISEENTESALASKIDQTKVPIKSRKVPKCNLKPLKYSCSTCGKKWKTSAELKTHIKTHSTLRPYMCEKCGQVYKHKHALEIHVGMHNGVNPFQCSFCNKCFTQKGALMRHLPIHTGEMPYQCELCGKRFIHHTSYNMHKLSHSGKKSYKCNMCDLSLLSTSHLKRHMRAHTGEKPYSCTLCGKRFAERYNLLAHQKIHDPFENKTKKANEISYQCNHCNLVFEQKESLNDHMKSHIEINNESNVKKTYSVMSIQSETNELSKKVNSDHSALQETWIQMNRSKTDAIDNETKFILLQNPLPEIDDSSFTVTFNDQKVSMESTNYDTNLQVIIEPSNASLLNSNLSHINKTHT